LREKNDKIINGKLQIKWFNINIITTTK